MTGKTGSASVEPIWVDWGELLVDSELDEVRPFWDLDLSTLLQEVGDRLGSLVLVDVLDGGRSCHFTYRAV
ncbi:hypothetical protein GCK72_000555 [Caenorhabditis remanei]|uniref:Uncharacterized protein n=1 Tax=Caenorhabditis remanei TaxID=31234 RepID=A0A6A5HSJ7_CAERE|nr:hypothetical protein GCK72_000555 [Caenorhabditis remanei]KAF1768742.1 hypothetical protein GCK72_000555 [Caenorhabditis remanei]